MIQIKRHSGIYTFTATQELPISLKEAWDFFSLPDNLAEITPPEMRFQITSGPAEKVYVGQIITYKVSPLPGLRISWVTEITQVEELYRFIDEQRFGPYRMWHHEHTFEATADGVLMTDKVSYKIPLGPMGHLMQKIMIGNQLRSIFKYRNKKLLALFGPVNQQPEANQKDHVVA